MKNFRKFYYIIILKINYNFMRLYFCNKTGNEWNPAL